MAKLDAKTIIAWTGLVSVLLGGVEMRMAVNRLEDKTARIEERVVGIEHRIAPRVARGDEE